MSARTVAMFVIAATGIVLACVTGHAQREAAPQVTDADAYAVYAAVLPGVWTSVSKDAILLQQETEGIAAVSGCLSQRPGVEPDWDVVEANFRQVNARTSLLDRMFPFDAPFRLIHRADILANDARLSAKYHGGWERLPEAMEYAAVSAVGFNATKDKALVYVRLRSTGNLHDVVRLRGGKWIAAQRNGGCGGWRA